MNWGFLLYGAAMVVVGMMIEDWLRTWRDHRQFQHRWRCPICSFHVKATNHDACIALIKNHYKGHYE